MKFPRTPHLPWSQGVSSDDRTMLNPEARFGGRLISITEKMDGENTTMTRDHIHARSEDSGYHPSRSWVKSLWGDIRHTIPDGWSIVGENLYAKHSIYYDNLPSYFLVFAVINNGVVLSTANTAWWCAAHDLSHVPILGSGLYVESLLSEHFCPAPVLGPEAEGYVVRREDSFLLNDWGESVAKYVRASHVQTSEHWMHDEMVKNKLGPDVWRVGRVR